MSVFQRRRIDGDDLRHAPSLDGDCPAQYMRVIQTFPGLPGPFRISVTAIVRALDLALGTKNTELLLSGNTPTVIMTAGPIIEDQMSKVTVPNKDLQTNLMTNILKECAHVEGLPPNPAARLAHVQQLLARFDFDQTFAQHVYNVLAHNDAIMVPWQLIDQYPIAVPA
ncbi:MAG TPA: hypothetical protein VN081_02535 [Dongiaceae bacterium]|nr:hypothetical protein [Dongiaceae bacterium]